MALYSSFAPGSAGCIRAMLCEPDPSIRVQLRELIDDDPLLTLANESRNWAECEKSMDELVPELLIARSDLIPAAWTARMNQDSFLPVVIALRNGLGPVAVEQQPNVLPMPADPEAVRRCLNQAVRQIYDRKAKQLLYLVEKYVAGSNATSGYKSVLRVERDGQPVDLRTDTIVSIIAARKSVSIQSMDARFFLREPIHVLAAQLDPHTFVRIHRSVVINRRYLDRTKSLSSRSSAVVLLDGSTYPIGPSYRDALRDASTSDAA